MAHALRRFAVPGKPGDGSNRARDEQKPIRILQLAPGQEPSKISCYSQPGEIVIRQRRMARVRRNQNFFSQFDRAENIPRKFSAHLGIGHVLFIY